MLRQIRAIPHAPSDAARASRVSPSRRAARVDRRHGACALGMPRRAPRTLRRRHVRARGRRRAAACGSQSGSCHPEPGTICPTPADVGPPPWVGRMRDSCQGCKRVIHRGTRLPEARRRGRLQGRSRDAAGTPRERHTDATRAPGGRSNTPAEAAWAQPVAATTPADARGRSARRSKARRADTARGREPDASTAPAERRTSACGGRSKHVSRKPARDAARTARGRYTAEPTETRRRPGADRAGAGQRPRGGAWMPRAPGDAAPVRNTRRADTPGSLEFGRDFLAHAFPRSWPVERFSGDVSRPSWSDPRSYRASGTAALIRSVYMCFTWAS